MIVLMVLLVVGTMLYVTYNKDRVLKMVSAELNQKMDGQVIIGDLKPQFFKGFPQFSLELKNVQIRDRRFAAHHHTLLDAKEFYVSLNAFSLLTGKASIGRIDIDHASADLYTDSTGYSNLSVFKKGGKKPEKGSDQGGPPPELQVFSFSQLELKVDDQHKKKLFYFHVNSLKGQMSNAAVGWQGNFHLEVLANNMSFKTSHGSFLKNKQISGTFSASGDDDGKINLQSEALRIDQNLFKLDAVFGANKRPADFAIHLTCDQINWRQASELLADNIKKKLDQYNISQPLAVTARINGSFGGGDPFIYVTAKVHDSKITTPAVLLENCSFNGIFTNNYQDGKGFNDDNSVIHLIGLSGSYLHIPFSIDTGSIINLNKTIATGNLRANFPVASLNELLGNKVARFTKGRADLSLRYRGDIVDYRLNKPAVAGYIHIKNADITYIPEKLKVVNSSLSLHFIKNDLILNNIRLQSGRSIITMDGKVKNFMNLYYDAPEKILLTWQIRSQQMYLGEFLGFLSGSGAKPSTKPRPAVNSGNAIDQLSNVLEKGSADMHLEVANVHYFKFLATDVHANLLTSEDAVQIRNVGLKHAGGFLKLSGTLQKGSDLNKLLLKTSISHVDVHEFF